MSHWKNYGADFAMTPEALVAESSWGGKAILDTTTFTNVTFKADIVLPSGSGGDAGLVFRVSDPTVGTDSYQGYYAGINAAAGSIVLGRANNGYVQIGYARASIKTEQVHHMMVQASGDHLIVYVDDFDTPKITVRDATYTKGNVGVRVYGTGATFKNLVIEGRSD